MKTKISISIPLAAILLCAILTAASADIAPPLQPPGANPAPLEYEKTHVEMGFESVRIYVEETSNLYYTDTSLDTVNARVVALFMMGNQSEAAETLKVLFPLNDTEGRGDGAWSYPEIQNLRITVNEQSVTWVEKTTPNPRGSDDPEIKWAEFEVEFPSKEVTFIEILYDLQSTGWFPEATFHYVLETGGGWYGPIGEAHIDLILPYEASVENVLFGDPNSNYYEQKTSPGADFEGNEVHWDYTDLEPDAEDNWEATIIAPPIWEQILDLRERIDQGDGSAYAEITTIYDDLYLGHGIRQGTEGLIFLNYDAYHKALEFDPKDDDVLARFADFMLTLDEIGYGWEETPIELEDIYAMASHALEINPLNDLAPYVISELENPPYNFTPASPSATPEQPVDSGNQSPQEGSENDAVSVEDQREDPSQASESQNNTILYLLGAGLLAAVGVIIVLVYKLGKKNAS
jgi:hypothetical protein